MVKKENDISHVHYGLSKKTVSVIVHKLPWMKNISVSWKF